MGLDLGGGFERVRECGEDSTAVGLERGRRQTGLRASAGHFFDTASPSVNVAGFEAGGGDERVAGLRGVGAEKGLGGEVVGQRPFVPECEPVIIDPTLDMNTAAVGFVDHRIEKCLTQSLARIGRCFVAMDTFEADGFDEKFTIRALEDFRQGVDEVVLDDFMKAEIGIIFHEATESNADTGVESERILAEENDGSALEAAVLGETEFFHELRKRKLVCAGHAVGLVGIGEKTRDGGRIEVIHCGAFFDDRVPSEPAFTEKEFVERSTVEFLGHTAAAIIIATAQRDRHSRGFDADFNRVVGIRRNEVDRG